MSFLLVRQDHHLSHPPPSNSANSNQTPATTTILGLPSPKVIHPASSPSPSAPSPLATSPSIPRRPTRPSLRSCKTENGVANQTILEADEHPNQQHSSPSVLTPATTTTTTSPSSQPLPLSSSLTSVTSLSATSSRRHSPSPTASSFTNRGLDLDNLLGPRRSSTSCLSLRDEKSSSCSPVRSFSQASHIGPHVLPSQTPSNQILYSSPNPPWLSQTHQLVPAHDSCSLLSSSQTNPHSEHALLRPRSSTASTIDSLNSLPPNRTSSSSCAQLNPQQATVQAQHSVNSRSHSTPSLPLSIPQGQSPDQSTRPPSSQANSTSAPHPSLRPRADSYNHTPPSWKPWSTGRGTCGPLDYIPPRDSPAALDRKSWMASTPAPGPGQHVFNGSEPSNGDSIGPSVIPRSLSLHDLHTFTEHHNHHNATQPSMHYGPGASHQPPLLSRPINARSNAPGSSLGNSSSLYSEPLTSFPNAHQQRLCLDHSSHGININSLSLSTNSHQASSVGDARSNSYSDPHLPLSSSGSGLFATPLTSATRRVDPTADEISTIFVVGFPDDMNEREFQNMFMFSNGFEAATLKVPASTLAARERDITAAVVAAAAAAAGAVKPAGAVGFGPNTQSHRIGGLQQQPNGLLVDQFGMPLVSLEGYEEAYLSSLGIDPQFVGSRHQSIGLAGPMVAAGCLGAAANLQGMIDLQAGAGAGMSTRKQIIGFAKFRTRADALHARDVLSGRKVDAEKGNILKAEMAKKNLHTKRGLSNEIVGLNNPSGQPNPVLVNHSQSQLGSMTESDNGVHHVMINNQPTVPPQPLGTLIGPDKSIVSRPLESFKESGLDEAQREAGFDSWQAASRMMGILDRPSLPPPHRPTLDGCEHNRYSGRHAAEKVGSDESHQASDERKLSIGNDWVNHPSPMIEASLGKSLWDKLEEHEISKEGEEAEVESGGCPTSSGDVRKVERSRTGVEGFQENSGHAGGTGSVGSSGSSSSYPPSSNATGSAGVSLLWGSGTAVRPNTTRVHYPADQNPAINTLYVGGLPAVIEGGLTPDNPNGMMLMMSSEELEGGLRKVFSRANGYKRLSYKVKNQQPMCFIEFETVEQASEVMEKLYGDKIEGKVPGGIRLAYSRNALGVRSTGSSSCSSVTSSQPPIGGGHHHMSL